MADSQRSKDRNRMTTVYDEDGKEHVVSNLNAHDLVNHAGYTRHNPVRPAKAAPPAAPKAPVAPKPPASVDLVSEAEAALPQANVVDGFTEMAKEDLVTYAKDNFKVQLDGRKSRAALLAEVRKLVVTLVPTAAQETQGDQEA